MNPGKSWRTVMQVHQRFGLRAAGKHVFFSLLNRFMLVDCLEITVLERAHLRELPAEAARRSSYRFADRDDLLAMRADPQWEIGDEKIALFDRGDRCVLSLIDGVTAGYTWVHADGQPEPVPGLRIRVPPQYLYNYAGFTLPAYRGANLQSVRHHSVLGQAEWADRAGLCGYVRHVNFASKKGQARSGFRIIGSIWRIGGQQRHLTWFSPALRAAGIGRIDRPQGGETLPVRPPIAAVEPGESTTPTLRSNA